MILNQSSFFWCQYIFITTLSLPLSLLLCIIPFIALLAKIIRSFQCTSYLSDASTTVLGLKSKPRRSSHGHPVINWNTTRLKNTRRRDCHKHRAAFQQVPCDVCAKTFSNLLPQITAMNVGSTLSNISLEFEVVCIPLLFSMGQKAVAVYQYIPSLLAF